MTTGTLYRLVAKIRVTNTGGPAIVIGNGSNQGIYVNQQTDGNLVIATCNGTTNSAITSFSVQGGLINFNTSNPKSLMLVLEWYGGIGDYSVISGGINGRMIVSEVSTNWNYNAWTGKVGVSGVNSASDVVDLTLYVNPVW
jgi:uncharacterized protein YodC (DUF2158 family)